jgi:hypothetical protein
MTKCLQESRMREIRTSGLTRGSNGIGASRPLLSTLLVKNLLFIFPFRQSVRMPRLAGSRVGVDGQAFSPAGGNSGSQSVGRDKIVEMRHLTLFTARWISTVT